MAVLKASNFNALTPDATLASQDGDWTDISGETYVRQSGSDIGVSSASSNQQSFSELSAMAATQDGYIQCKRISCTGRFITLALRGSGTYATTFRAYALRIFPNGSMNFRRLLGNGGSEQLGDTSETGIQANGDTIRFEVEGHTLRAYVNGSLEMERTESTNTVTTDGKAYLIPGGNLANNGVLVDDVEIGTFAAGEIVANYDAAIAANIRTGTTSAAAGQATTVLSISNGPVGDADYSVGVFELDGTTPLSWAEVTAGTASGTLAASGSTQVTVGLKGSVVETLEVGSYAGRIIVRDTTNDAVALDLPISSYVADAFAARRARIVAGQHVTFDAVDKLQAVRTGSTTVTGVVIQLVGMGNELGDGTLRYTHSTTSLTWQAPGDTEGAPVDVSVSERCHILYSGDGHASLYVFTTPANLPVADQSDEVAISWAWRTFLPQPRGWCRDPHALPGVLVRQASHDTPLGIGTISWDDTAKQLQWAAAGDDPGTVVNIVGDGGKYKLFSDNGSWVRVEVDLVALNALEDDAVDEIKIVDGGREANWLAYTHLWHFGNSHAGIHRYGVNRPGLGRYSWNDGLGHTMGHPYEVAGDYTARVVVIDERGPLSPQEFSIPIEVIAEPDGGWEQTLYVSASTGDDSDPGSDTEPMATPAAAIAAAAGKRTWIKFAADDEYEVTSIINVPACPWLRLDKWGEGANPLFWTTGTNQSMLSLGGADNLIAADISGDNGLPEEDNVGINPGNFMVNQRSGFTFLRCGFSNGTGSFFADGVGNDVGYYDCEGSNAKGYVKFVSGDRSTVVGCLLRGGNGEAQYRNYSPQSVVQCCTSEDPPIKDTWRFSHASSWRGAWGTCCRNHMEAAHGGGHDTTQVAMPAHFLSEGNYIGGEGNSITAYMLLQGGSRFFEMRNNVMVTPRYRASMANVGNDYNGIPGFHNFVSFRNNGYWQKYNGTLRCSHISAGLSTNRGVDSHNNLIMAPWLSGWSSGAHLARIGNFLPDTRNVRIDHNHYLVASLPASPFQVSNGSGGTSNLSIEAWQSAGKDSNSAFGVDPLVDAMLVPDELSPLIAAGDPDEAPHLDFRGLLRVGETTDIGPYQLDAVPYEWEAPTSHLDVTPLGGLSASGEEGGPFTPTSKVYRLANNTGVAIQWSAAITGPHSALFDLDVSSGEIPDNEDEDLTVTPDQSAAALLGAGTYEATLEIYDETNEQTFYRDLSLTAQAEASSDVRDISVSPDDEATAFLPTGPVGGPFSPSQLSIRVENIGNVAVTVRCRVEPAQAGLEFQGETDGELLVPLDPAQWADVVLRTNELADGLDPGVYETDASVAADDADGGSLIPVVLTVAGSASLTVTGVDPNAVRRGDKGVGITVSGTGFVDGATVQFISEA